VVDDFKLVAIGEAVRLMQIFVLRSDWDCLASEEIVEERMSGVVWQL